MTKYTEQPRLHWVDSMRGFSMLVVVFVHILTWSKVTSGDSFLVSMLMTFWMPLFFFVSGYFSYRLLSWWTTGRLSDIMKRKIQAQIIGATLFCTVYQFVMGGGISFTHGYGAYWFTIVLFQMYVVYLSLSLIGKALGRDIAIPSMAVISVVLCGIVFVYKFDSRLAEIFRWLNLAQYFQFFTLGLICRKYQDRFLKLLSDNLWITVFIVGWIISLLLMNSDWFTERFGFIASFNRNLLVRYLGLMCVVCVFFRYKSFCSSEHQSARVLRFIGRRTLDIYFIHFFFLPKVPEISTWLTTGNMIIFQILFASILTCAVTAMSLLLSGVLRCSPILASWLFGDKRKAAKPLMTESQKQ